MSKEGCVKQAYRSYVKTKAAVGERVPWSADFQQVWTQSASDGLWSISKRGFWREIGSQAKTALYNATGLGSPGQTLQVRVPDVTLNIRGYGKWVVDFKFDRPSGGTDTWRTKLGGGNGQLQQTDYKGMNRQNNPGQDIKDPKLDSETCKCNQRMKSPETVRVRVPMTVEQYRHMMNYNFMTEPRIFILPIPSPGALVGLLGAGATESGAAAGAQLIFQGAH
jgi:hypothetical protein